MTAARNVTVCPNVEELADSVSFVLVRTGIAVTEAAGLALIAELVREWTSTVTLP